MRSTCVSIEETGRSIEAADLNSPLAVLMAGPSEDEAARGFISIVPDGISAFLGPRNDSLHIDIRGPMSEPTWCEWNMLRESIYETLQGWKFSEPLRVTLNGADFEPETFCPAQAPVPAPSVGVWFLCVAAPGPDPRFVRVERTVPNGADPLQFAIQHLNAGPNQAERLDGLASGVVGIQEATLDAGGTLTLDHALDVEVNYNNYGLPGTVHVDASLKILTVFEFDEVKALKQTLGGDCEAYSAIGGGEGCYPFTRERFFEEFYLDSLGTEQFEKYYKAG